MTKRDMEMLDLVKCRIQFTSPEGEYEGTVHVVCPVTKKILVSKIVFLPKRTPMGTMNFKFHEILTYTVLTRPETSDLQKTESTKKSYAYAPTRGKDTCFLDDCSEAGDFESNDDVCVDDLYEEEAYELKIPPKLSSRIPIDNVVIDHIDDEFHLAIKHIFQQDCIGVTLEGPKVGRNGILSWLGMSTSSCTFLFDIESLGERAFKEGLKEILENPNIEKVFHDCRQASDCLFHKYSTRLVNVFDTQVADLLVTMQRSQNTKLIKRVSHLDSCLRTYLEIPEEYIHKPKSFRSYQDEVAFSRLRPMQSHQRDVVLKNVMYLRLLKRELNFAMLTPFHRAVEIYLQVLQTASDQELLLDPSIPEELPQELLLEGVQVVCFKEFVDVPPIVASGPPYRKLNNPVRNYADYCKKLEESQQDYSQSGSENEVLSCTNAVNSEGKSIEIDSMPMSPQVGTQFHSKSKIIENRVSFHENQVHQSVPPLIQSAIKKSALPISDISPKDFFSTKVYFLNPTDSDEKTSSTARYINSNLRHRVNQSKDDLQSSNSSTETCPSADSSDDETEEKPRQKSYQDILIKFRENQRPRPSKQPSFSESSSDCVDSGDDDPWAALRAEFASSDCSASNVETRFRFVPA